MENQTSPKPGATREAELNPGGDIYKTGHLNEEFFMGVSPNSKRRANYTRDYLNWRSCNDGK